MRSTASLPPIRRKFQPRRNPPRIARTKALNLPTAVRMFTRSIARILRRKIERGRSVRSRCGRIARAAHRAVRRYIRSPAFTLTPRRLARCGAPLPCVRNSLNSDRAHAAPAPFRFGFVRRPLRDDLDCLRRSSEICAVARRSGRGAIRARGFYSVDTVKHFKQKHHGTGAHFYFLLGADSFLDIPTWKDYENLLGLCDFIVASRPVSLWIRCAW